MDDVVLRCSVRELSENASKKMVRDDIVKRTSGFDYERHFRKMLIQLLGLVQVERIERKVDPVKKTQFKSTLLTLKTSRNGS